MSENDLIRRGDVENALRTDLRDDDATRLASAWALNRLRALPADPRAVLPPDARERIARVLWSFPQNRQNDKSWEEIMHHAPPDKWPHGCPAAMLRHADAILAGLAAEPEPAPRPCDACGTHDGRIERVEGDHLGATVWYERCPTCQPYPVTP